MRHNPVAATHRTLRSSSASGGDPLPLILFVCSQGKQRSRTAYDLCAAERAYWPHWSFGYGGVSINPDMPIDAFDVQRAAKIVVMERKHIFLLRSRFPQVRIDEERVVCLDIPDEYEYFDDDLVKTLQKLLNPILKRSA